jgi:hypothetical protein
MFDIVATSDEIRGLVGNLHPDWTVTSSHDDFGEDRTRHSIFLTYFRPSERTPGKVQNALTFYVTPQFIRIGGGPTIPHTAPDWKADLIAALGAQPVSAG